MNTNKQGNKGAIGFLGLVSIGITSMVGTGWLLLPGIWLDIAHGPFNLIVAFILCILIEIPLAFSYLEAIPAIPVPGGELVYTYAAFGKFPSFMVGWAGFLKDAILFCWVNLAAVSLLGELFPKLSTTMVLYSISDYRVTLPNVVIQLALAGLMLAIQLNGSDVFASFAKITTVIVMAAFFGCIAVAFCFFDPAVYAADSGLRFELKGSLSLMATIVFSVSGWEVVAKAAADSRREDQKKAGLALVICLVSVSVLLCLVATAVAGILPWTSAAGLTTPIADALVHVLHAPALRVVLIFTALFGALGIMNSGLYSASRMMFGLARVGLIPRGFSRLSAYRQIPGRCICFTFAFVLFAPFLGSYIFRPLISIVGLATSVLWVSTFCSVLRLRKKAPHLERPIRMPGGGVTAVLGAAASVVLLGNILLPMSPGALSPLEYAITALLALLGVVLYQLRDRALTAEEQSRLILGKSFVSLREAGCAPQKREEVEP